MRYSLLGRSGLRVSKLALGTMTFGPGADWSRSEEDCRPVFDAFVEAGGNFIDTANMYTGGESEKIVGRLVAADQIGRAPSELQSLMRISSAVFCLKKKKRH